MISGKENRSDSRYGTVKKEKRLELIERQIVEKNLPDAESSLRDLICLDPMDSRAFHLFSELKALRGEMPESQAANYRCLQLKQFEDRPGVGHSLERYMTSLDAANSSEKIFAIGSYRFSSLRVHQEKNGMLAVGCSLDGSAFLKVFLRSDGDSESNFKRDVDVLQHLSDNRCVSSPEVLGKGFVERSRIVRALPESTFSDFESETCPYVLLRYARADRGGFSMADVLLSILEQRALGIYHDRIALRHIRFDSVTGVCRLVGYHRATELKSSVSQLPLKEFWEWCLQREALQSTISQSRFLAGLNSETDRIISDNRLNLAYSSIFSKQRIATAPEPKVQEVEHPEMFLEATRNTVDSLSGLSFQTGERVLEIGCGTGLISRYLGERGCAVTGINFHAEQILGAQILNNLSKLDGQFQCKDLDYEDVSGEFDTICLFSSLHHFWKVDAVVDRIRALHPNRIIIEAGISERGYKWLGRWFQKTPGWSFSDQEDFVSWLEGKFPGLNLEIAPISTCEDRHIYVMERRILR